MTRRKSTAVKPIEVKNLPVDWIDINDDTEFTYISKGHVFEETDILLFSGNLFGARLGRVTKYIIDYGGFVAGDVLIVDLYGNPIMAVSYLELD